MCPVKEHIFIYDDECQKPEPCELSMTDGECEAPEAINGLHLITVLAAIAKEGPHNSDIELGRKIDRFVGMMMGAVEEKGPRLPWMHGGKGKRKNSNPFGDFLNLDPEKELRSMFEKFLGSEGAEKGKVALNNLSDMLKGGNGKDGFSDMMKKLFSDDGPDAEKFREVLEGLEGLMTKMRRKRSSPIPPGLSEKESLLAPRMNCVSNKERNGCLCCCNWYLPDRNSNKCVEVKDGLKSFIRDFVPRAPGLGFKGFFGGSNPLEGILDGLH